MNKYALGYLQLNPKELEVYEIIEKAFVKQATSFDASGIGRSINLMMIFQMVLGDNPDIIYLNKTQLRSLVSLFRKQISFTGCLNKSQAGKLNKQLDQKVQEALWEIDKNAYTDKDILLGISEYLQRNVIYDRQELACCSKGKSIRPNAHNAFGALIEGKAVCDGISSAYALIAQQLGFRCMVVNGISNYHNAKVEHAWNIVEYNGKFYHVDATWDINQYEATKNYSYGYFGLDDDEISFDHNWDINYTPICKSNELSYYKERNLFVNSESQIEDVAIREIKKGNKVIRMKISEGIALPEDTDNYIAQKIINASIRIGKSIQISFIWNDSNRCFEATIS